MAVTSPYRWGWFCLDEQLEIPADLLEAYNWSDYLGERTGQGRWVDLYSDAKREIPLGRLWSNGNTTGLLHVDDEDSLNYTIVALRLRDMARKGVVAQDAFDTLAQDYTAGPVFQGDLDGIDDPTLPDNANI